MILSPEGPLTSQDFAGLAREVDPYIERNGKLARLLIDAASFRGWHDFGAQWHLDLTTVYFFRFDRPGLGGATVSFGSVAAIRLGNPHLTASVIAEFQVCTRPKSSLLRAGF